MLSMPDRNLFLFEEAKIWWLPLMAADRLRNDPMGHPRPGAGGFTPAAAFPRRSAARDLKSTDDL